MREDFSQPMFGRDATVNSFMFGFYVFNNAGIGSSVLRRACCSALAVCSRPFSTRFI